MYHLHIAAFSLLLTIFNIAVVAIPSSGNETPKSEQHIHSYKHRNIRARTNNHPEVGTPEYVSPPAPTSVAEHEEYKRVLSGIDEIIKRSPTDGLDQFGDEELRSMVRVAASIVGRAAPATTGPSTSVSTRTDKKKRTTSTSTTATSSSSSSLAASLLPSGAVSRWYAPVPTEEPKATEEAYGKNGKRSEAVSYSVLVDIDPQGNTIVHTQTVRGTSARFVKRQNPESSATTPPAGSIAPSSAPPAPTSDGVFRIQPVFSRGAESGVELTRTETPPATQVESGTYGLYTPLLYCFYEFGSLVAPRSDDSLESVTGTETLPSAAETYTAQGGNTLRKRSNHATDNVPPNPSPSPMASSVDTAAPSVATTTSPMDEGQVWSSFRDCLKLALLEMGYTGRPAATTPTDVAEPALITSSTSRLYTNEPSLQSRSQTTFATQTSSHGSGGREYRK